MRASTETFLARVILNSFNADQLRELAAQLSEPH
jgi:hypothetical protein